MDLLSHKTKERLDDSLRELSDEWETAEKRIHELEHELATRRADVVVLKAQINGLQGLKQNLTAPLRAAFVEGI